MTLNDRDLLRLLESVETTAKGMRPISTGLLAGRAARLRSARATATVQAAAAGSGGGQGGGTHSDPTLAAAGSAADRAARVHAEIDQEDQDLVRAMRILADVVDRNRSARVHADIDREDEALARAFEMITDVVHRTRPARVQADIDREDEELALAFRLVANVADRNARALHPPKDPAPKQKPLTGCRSCARDNGYWEPVAMGQYGDLCRRCGDFKGIENRLPPLGAVVYLHATGRRWTNKVLADALRAEREGRAKAGAR